MRHKLHTLGIWAIALAASQAGCGKSPADARLEATQAPQPSRPAETKPYLFDRAVALCIGVDDYEHVADIRFAEADARAVGALLHESYGFTPDTSLVGPRATKENILARLDDYGRSLGERDALLVFFALHGKVIDLPLERDQPPRREGFLIPREAKLSLADVRDVVAWRKEALSMRDDLLARLPAMKARHVVFVVDACCSGFMTQRGGSLRQRRDLQLLVNAPSRAVISATTDSQAALWNEEAGHGYFTSALLATLGQLAERREAASLTDVFEDVRRRVGSLNKGMMPQMNPRAGVGDGEFVFLPSSIRKSDVDLVARLAEQTKPALLAQAGRGHILAATLQRQLERENLKVGMADVIEAAEAPDYRFAIDVAAQGEAWRKKLARFKEAASSGDPLAMAALHFCYAKGLGTTRDEPAAVTWALTAYESGQAAGLYVVARCLAQGLGGVPRNRAAALALMSQGSERGDTLCQVEVAREELSQVTSGQQPLDPKRSAAALTLLEKAFARGSTDAGALLGRAYCGLPPEPDAPRPARPFTEDRERGVKYLEAAAARGNAGANLGLFEQFLIADPQKARDALIRSADRGLAAAQHRLALGYLPEAPPAAFSPVPLSEEANLNRRLGIITPRDLAAAPIREARHFGDQRIRSIADASTLLAKLFERPLIPLQPDPEHAHRYADLAAGQDYTPAVALVALAQATGLFPEDGLAASLPRLEAAASAGSPLANAVVGFLREQGRGYPPDTAAARAFYRRAALAGHPWGCYQYARYWATASGDPRIANVSVSKFALAGIAVSYLIKAHEGGYPDSTATLSSYIAANMGGLFGGHPSDLPTDGVGLVKWAMGYQSVRKSMQDLPALTARYDALLDP